MAGVWARISEIGKRDLPPRGHEDARHQREVEAHVALVAADLGIAEVVDDVGRPLVRLGQQDPAGVLVVDDLAAALEEGVGLRQVLAVGALPDVEVGHRVQPETVDAQVQPEPHGVDHGVADGGAVEVEVRLVGEEPVPEVLLADRVERPVARLGVHEDHPRVRDSRCRRRPRRRSRRTARQGCAATPGTSSGCRWCGS